MRRTPIAGDLLPPAAAPLRAAAAALPAWRMAAVLLAALAAGSPAGLAQAQATGPGAPTTTSRPPGKTAANAPATVAADTTALIRGLDCMIQPSQVVQIGSPAPGVIEHILVDRGDMVRSGQPVVELNASVERAALALAQQRASQQGELAATTGAKNLAERELQRADELYRKKFVSGTYLDKQRAEAEVAGGRSTEAAERQALAARELALASAQLAQRTLRSPITGVVVDRSLAVGEYMDQKPVLRIAAIDPLRVDVLVPAAAFGLVTLGMAASVVPELVDRRSLGATVKTVDRVIDAASNTFRVRLNLPNPGGTLPAGLRCKVDLGAAAAAQTVATAGQAAAPVAGAGVASARR